MKKKVLSTAVMLGIAFGASSAFGVQTETVQFNPDGAPGGDAPVRAKVFDWAPGNALSVNSGANLDGVGDGTPGAIGNFFINGAILGLPAGQGARGDADLDGVPDAPGLLPTTFNTFFHAKLDGILGAANQIVTPVGLINGDYEITLALGFEEDIFNVQAGPGGLGSNGDTAQFLTTGRTVGVPNFFEIWWDDNPNADDLAGTGFNDGTLILGGTIQADAPGTFSTNFSTTNDEDQDDDGNPDNPLDASGANDYPNIFSIDGIGGTDLDISVDFQNGQFFPLNITEILLTLLGTRNNLNFEQVDPSALFADTAGGGAPTLVGAGSVDIGAVNGRGKDLLLETDAAQSFLALEVAVPEPATAGLAFMGTFSLLGSLLRRRKA